MMTTFQLLGHLSKGPRLVSRTILNVNNLVIHLIYTAALSHPPQHAVALLVCMAVLCSVSDYLCFWPAVVYLGFRVLFPIFWAMGGKWNPLIELSTQPCYGVLNLWKASLVHQLLVGAALRPLLPADEPMFIAAVAGGHVAITLGAGVVQFIFSKILAAGFEAPTVRKIYGKKN